jgi:hypothetical protein
MASQKKLADAIYDQEIQRMSNLTGFPHLPRAQQDYRRVMRRITECDAVFLHRVISEVVDTRESCPTPQELQATAGEIRRRGVRAGGVPNCPDCHGEGWVHGTRMVTVPGMEPYEAEYSGPCKCSMAASRQEVG